MCQMGHGRHHSGMGGQGCCMPGGGLRAPGCCCCGGMMFGHRRGFGFRRFISPAEELENLREYLEELKKETAGVEARIHELKGQK